MKIKKAVIPAAGLGTRFLPVTKSVPKELLPILDKPMLHYVVEEAVEAGVEQVIVVTSPGKESIAAYFQSSPELDRHLASSGSLEMLEKVRRAASLAQVSFVIQEKPLGLGHAVLTAQIRGAAPSDPPFGGKTPERGSAFESGHRGPLRVATGNIRLPGAHRSRRQRGDTVDRRVAQAPGKSGTLCLRVPGTPL